MHENYDMDNNRSIEIKSISGNWKSFPWYLLSRENMNERIFYCPNLKTALLLTRETAQSITSDYVPSSIDKTLEKKESNPVYPVEKRPKAFHLAIGLTNNCSLGCLYCHAEADKNVVIDSSYIDMAIEYAFQNAKNTPQKTLTVSFAVGGEPTLEWNLFMNTVTRIKEYERQKHHGVEKVFLSMTTNCYYGAEKRKFIADNFDTLTLSLDGFKEIHDLHRPARNSEGSFEIVKESCEYYIKSTSVKVGLRATVSSLSVKELPRIVSYYSRAFGNRFSVTFEPLVQIGRALKNSLQSPDEEEFARFFWEAYKIGKEINIKVTSSGVNINRLITRYCGAMSIPSFTLCTNGNLTACHRDQEGKDYFYGNIDLEKKEIIIKNSLVERNIELSRLPNECMGCFAKLHCAGDCPDIRRLKYSRCSFNRYIIFKQLEELLRSKAN